MSGDARLGSIEFPQVIENLPCGMASIRVLVRLRIHGFRLELQGFDQIAVLRFFRSGLGYLGQHLHMAGHQMGP